VIWKKTMEKIREMQFAEMIKKARKQADLS